MQCKRCGAPTPREFSARPREGARRGEGVRKGDRDSPGRRAPCSPGSLPPRLPAPPPDRGMQKGGAWDSAPLASSQLAQMLLVQNPTWRTIKLGGGERSLLQEIRLQMGISLCKRKVPETYKPGHQGHGEPQTLRPLPCLPPPGKGRPHSPVPGPTRSCPSILVKSCLGL